MNQFQAEPNADQPSSSKCKRLNQFLVGSACPISSAGSACLARKTKGAFVRPSNLSNGECRV